MKKFFFLFCFVFCLFFLFPQNAENLPLQDEEKDSSLQNAKTDDADFQFEDNDEEESHFSVSIGGGIYVGASPFFNSFSNFGDVKPSSLLWGHLHLEASAPLTKAFISSKLNNDTLPFNLGEKWATSKKYTIPQFIDEAFLQISIGAFDISAGLKKITWGKTDALSTLDVINPKDKSKFHLLDEDAKMSVPLFQGIAYLPHDVKIETVFLPIFEPDLFAIEGRWQPYSVSIAKKNMKITKTDEMFEILQKDTAKLNFSHGGARLSTTIDNLHDIAFQYFYGWNKAPLIRWDEKGFFPDYLQMHNIGADYGVAIGHVNLKLEIASNIMGDSASDSNFEWNAELESSLPHGFSLQLILKETAWFKNLKNEKNNLSYIFFRKTHRTDTTLLASLSQNILRGALEWKLLFLANFEDVDFAISPSIHAIFGTILFDAQVVVFLGRGNEGIYSQYNRNNFLKLSVGYEF